MQLRLKSSVVDQNRRRLLGAAALGILASGVTNLLPAGLAAASEARAVRPFKIKIPDARLADLRRRILATRWPDRETVADDTQGIQLAPMQELAHRWGDGYSWRKIEAELNALSQFMTEIDGLDIHFIHVRSKHENALPVIVTHGWPGSVFEQLKIIDPLVNPTTHGASASDAFDVVVPSLPGFGFSGKPTATGWGPERTARAWVVLMKRLGYTRRGARGRSGCGSLYGDGLAGAAGIARHSHQLPRNNSVRSREGAAGRHGLVCKRRAYAQMLATRPQTLYGLADSPVGLAAWLCDHGDGYGQPAASIISALAGHTVNGHPAGDLTRDDVLDDVTLYWLTNTAVSAARFYWESHFSLYNAADVFIPAAVSVFPGENYQAPRSWTERAYHKLIYYNTVDKGGHYAAWEQPALFSAELRAAFRSLRRPV